MKDFFCSILLVAVLSAALSFVDFSTVPMPGYGMGPKRPGNSGMVLPGKGSEPVHVHSQELSRNDSPSGNRIQTAEKTADPEDTARPENEMEEENPMDEIMIAFWHGVAAVLIGEASALLVAVAWMKIRESKMADEIKLIELSAAQNLSESNWTKEPKSYGLRADGDDSQ